MVTKFTHVCRSSSMPGIKDHEFLLAFSAPSLYSFAVKFISRVSENMIICRALIKSAHLSKTHLTAETQSPDANCAEADPNVICSRFSL